MLRFAETIPLRTRLPGAAWLVATLVALFSMLAMHAHAASEAPAPGVERTVPQGQDAPGPENGSQPLPDARPGESLSEQLDRNKGVITPPPTGDTEIETTAPNPDPGTTRVIPPPGTPGGDQSVQPK
jgi:hypothetical protein